MAEVVSLRVVRPYASEEEFLDAESFAINARSILLIDVPPHPEGATVRVELAIASGKSLLIAEGTVLKHLAASPSRPSGLVVRFRRMSAASSEFIKRAVAANADKSLPSSALPSQVLASIPAPRSEASALEHSASTVDRSSRPSDSPAHPAKSSRNSDSMRAQSVPPRARSVSVIPAARRSATPLPPAPLPPTFPDIPTEPPALATPRVTLPSAPPPKSAKGSLQGPQSTRDAPSVALKGSQDVPKGDGDPSHHDTEVMARLRERHGKKTISVPPNREAILARLKKPVP